MFQEDWLNLHVGKASAKRNIEVRTHAFKVVEGGGMIYSFRNVSPLGFQKFRSI